VLNQNRFLLRRARLRLADSFSHRTVGLDYALQLDANTIAGFAFGLRDAEVGFSWAPGGFDEQGRTQPLGKGLAALRVRAGGGVIRIPFGYDVYEASHARRIFSEPSLLANAFFPGDYDLGVRLQIDYGDLHLVAGLLNGEPIGARGFSARDPNAAKDWFLRVHGNANPWERLHLEGGLSFTKGTGFHQGTPATKDSLVWRDFNEDGIAQQFEIQVVRGASATASENFERWAAGADLRARIDLPFGALTLFGEAATGVNVDRSLQPADPVVLGAPQRGVTVHGGFVQEFGKWFLLGFRADHYDARLDSTDTQGGRLVRANRPFGYFSIAAALRLFESERRGLAGRLVVEAQRRRDRLARDEAGLPTDLSDDRVTLRMQVEF
jgi:hypothetical protein